MQSYSARQSATNAILFACIFSLTRHPHESLAGPILFERDVAPILRAYCLECHNKRDHRSEFSLHSRESTLKGGESGTAIVPGDTNSSYLLDLITPFNGVAEMPKGAAPLSPDEVSILQQWVESGAVWPDNFELEPAKLWSLHPLERPSVPENVGSIKHFPIRNPIDAFVLDRLEQAQLSPASPADPNTTIRRLYLDLTGLPPGPEQVKKFVQSTSPDAYSQLVDELLESPHFGEHWGRHWLDLARYADSEGYLGDSERPHAWIYRAWVIDAFNNDLPFDQFTIEQLAGDLLENSTLDQKIATGFHRNTLRNTEAGVDLELYRTKEIVDRVNTTGMVWLGMTLGCAECHDHKHDPVSQKEFYELYSFFNNADDVGVTATQPWEIAEYEQSLKSWQPKWDAVETELAKFEIDDLIEAQRDEISKIFAAYKKSSDLNKLKSYYRTEDPNWQDFEKRLANQLEKRPKKPVTKARTFAERTKDRRETHVHIRGVYNRPGEKVSPNTPAVLPPMEFRGKHADRLDLAKWLFHDDNPLTARVAVNRIWQQLFGVGIVSSPNDFGTKGSAPTHPVLLDWLASEYRRVGWSRKEIVRLIVNSSTYRMSSAHNSIPEQSAKSNQLLWRQNSYRVSSESVRDLHLAASGLLDRTIGRKGIYPPLPDFVAEVGRSFKWPVTQGNARYRRGMYIFFKRTVPYPMLVTFDSPDSSVSCSRRERSNTPLQALSLLNDPLFFECAETIGKEVAEKFGDSLEQAIQEIYLRCLGRPASEGELKTLTAAYDDLLLIDSSNDPAKKPQRHKAFTGIARVVMNLDEFITRD